MEEVKGYKAFNKDATNRYGKPFTEGETYRVTGDIKFGNDGNGFHMCKALSDVFRYVKAEEEDVLVAEVTGRGKYVRRDDNYYGYYDMYACEEGVVGLVAGNICNATYRPTIVLSKDESGNWKGSGRSIPGVHIKEMLDVVNKTHPDVLVAYGGHSQACGLTVYDGKVDELRVALNEYCENTFPETLFVQQVVVDYVLKDPTELPILYSQKNALEPFGCDFPEPIVMVKFKPEETRVVKDGKHLIFRYKGMEIISWNSGYHLDGHTVGEIEEVVAIGNIEKAATLNVQPEMLQIQFK